jgi:hypothetical protein
VRRLRRTAGLAIAAWLVAAICAGRASAQNVTTGTLSGKVTDSSSAVLPGVDVVAVHEPTGTQYTAVTQGDGSFAILNAQVGPYSVTAKLASFQEQTKTGITVRRRRLNSRSRFRA